MKLIDEKGRLFGKLNIIDLLIILVVLGGLIGVNYKLGFIKKMGGSTLPQKKSVVKFWVKNVSPYIASAVTTGDTVKELKSGSEIGRITNVEVKPYKDAAPDANGNWVLSEVPEKKDVFITVESSIAPVNGQLRLGSKDGKVGVGIDIKGTNFQASSYVIGVE